MEKKKLIFVLATMMMSFIFLSLSANVVGADVGANSTVTLTIGNSDPVIVSVDSGNSGDPEFCAVSNQWIAFNATDDDGYADFDLAATYANLSKGAVDHQSTSCAEISHGDTWMYINCTVIAMDYGDVPAADWSQVVHVVDDSAGIADDSSTTFTYNGAASVNTTATIPFGTVSSNTIDNVNIGAQITLENCANQEINNAITGSDVTGEGTIGVGNLTVSETASNVTGTNLALTTGSQAFTPGADLAVGDSLNIWYYISIPLGQAQGVYDTAVLEWVATDST